MSALGWTGGSWFWFGGVGFSELPAIQDFQWAFSPDIKMPQNQAALACSGQNLAVTPHSPVT